ncbi:hypothetical protein ACJJTC_003943 [Scirpophaga incertulas]
MDENNIVMVCRTCLAKKANRDITQLEDRDSCRSYGDVLLFCLDIQLEPDSKISSRLCLKCYNKIKSFYQFKSIALKNDAYLKTIVKCNLKNESELGNHQDQTLSCDSNKILEKTDIKVELEENSKENDGIDNDNYQSDDELLSVIKKIKYEFIETPDESNAKLLIQEEPIENIKVVKAKRKKCYTIERRVCDECGKSVRDLQAHMHTHKPNGARKTYPCTLCNQVYASNSARIKHHKSIHLGIKKCCPICNKKVLNIRQHNLVVHNKSELRFACASCGRRYITQTALDVHEMLHTLERPFPCHICDKKYRTPGQVQQHIKQVHNKEKSHLCQYCSKSFFKKYHLQLHLRTHTKEKPHECPECGKHFSTTTILNNHRLVHSEIKAYPCSLCDMSFVRSGYLRAHMISHTKEKKHACRYCGVRFGRSDHRKRHEFTAHERSLVEAADSDGDGDGDAKAPS